jgi:hypothetical protein
MAVVVDQTTIIEAVYRTIALAPPRRLLNGSYQLDLTGGTGRVYTIQWAQTLGNWSDLITVTNITGAIGASDSSTTTRRFYRVVERSQ